MTPFRADEFLPDWFMALNACLFLLVPLLATRISASRHKSERAAKLIAIALAQFWFVLLYGAQVIGLEWLEANLQVRLLLARIGYLAIGYAMSVYVLNGWVFDVYGMVGKRVVHTYQHFWKRWNTYLSSRWS